jgi:hypothetical protein
VDSILVRRSFQFVLLGVSLPTMGTACPEEEAGRCRPPPQTAAKHFVTHFCGGPQKSLSCNLKRTTSAVKVIWRQFIYAVRLLLKPSDHSDSESQTQTQTQTLSLKAFEKCCLTPAGGSRLAARRGHGGCSRPAGPRGHNS